MNPSRIALFAEQGHYTPVHNLALRVVMPQLSSSAWKVLCFLISETVGYQRRTEFISYSDIKTGTGIKSSATIARSLAELLEGEPFGCPLIVRQMGAKRGIASPESARYGLNLHCTVSLQKVKRRARSKIEPPTGSKSEAPIKELIEESNETLSREGDGSQNSGNDHFLAICEVCELDPELISEKRRQNVAERAAQLAEKYSPQQIRDAGARWPLPTAPLPDQLLDSIQALLRRKEKHDQPRPRAPVRIPLVNEHRNEHQRNAAQRRELMDELARRFR